MQNLMGWLIYLLTGFPVCFRILVPILGLTTGKFITQAGMKMSQRTRREGVV